MTSHLTTAVLGVSLHLLVVMCMFDIYFRSPIVHGMEPQSPRGEPPAKRLVLFVADGLRADKLYSLGTSAPFLTEIIHTKGAWGLSHTHVPTESRPGHVAIISGFYEDVSAVTTGWKENPVEFDSVFNESRYTWSWGSPDILPMFSRNHADHVFAEMYSSEDEDFAADSYRLDEWVFSRVEKFIEQASTDKEIMEKLSQDRVVLFLHLLGIDTVGHSKRPYSDAYRQNIIKVDAGVKRIYERFEQLFPDKRTAYIVTADHGMSDKGNHGDGEPANTETPLIAWGAGIRRPHHSVPLPEEQLAGRESAQEWTIQSPDNWKLNHIRRVDVEQGDIAPLMSCLIGAPFPVNSVGILPVHFLRGNAKGEDAGGFSWNQECLLANARQVLGQVEVQAKTKAEHTFFFKPFPDLNIDETKLELSSLRELPQEKYVEVERKAFEIIRKSIEALAYYQSYHRLVLMILTTLSYIGWMVYISFQIITDSNDNLKEFNLKEAISLPYPVLLLLLFLYTLIFLQNLPVPYYCYVLLPTYLWTRVYELIKKTTVRTLFGSGALRYSTFAAVASCWVLLEIQVGGFFRRELFGLSLLFLALWGWLQSEVTFVVRSCWVASCSTVAIFTLLPIGGDATALVIAGGLLVVGAGALLSSREFKSNFENLPENGEGNRIYAWQLIQMALLVISCFLVYNTENHLHEGRGLPLLNSLLSFFILFVSIVALIWLPHDIYFLDAFLVLFLNLATPFVLLSVSYEVLFYVAFGAMLFTWICLEMQLIDKRSFSTMRPPNDDNTSSRLKDLRISMFYVLFCWVAFFGTGNIASISSFQISSTYRFLTIFNPFKIGALLIIKLLLPFALVSCVFGIINRILNIKLLESFFMVIVACDVMALNFFFLVQDEGSWLDIGTSISHFCGTNGFILFHMALYGLSHAIFRNGIYFGWKAHHA